MPRLIPFLALLFAVVPLQAAEVYRYQDADGRWHFTDKKPKTQHDTLSFKEASDSAKPHLATKVVAGRTQVVAANPWWGPVNFWLRADGQELLQTLVPAQSEAPILMGAAPLEWQDNYEYRYILGDPKAQFDGKAMRAPVAAMGKYLISQGFNGRYSHTDAANAYALDIAMNVGDGVFAARAGTVVTTKDDYHMGGANDYFLDKANLIRVLHSDGSFGLYAHILMGSSLVKVGQQVEAGQQLARCGSSGYSTGPHLHFSIQVSREQGWQAVPFQLLQGGTPLTPEQGQWLQAE